MSELLLGDSLNYSLETRVFNAVLLITALGGVCATLLNLYSHNHVRELILTVSASFVPAGIYIRSRFFQAGRFLRTVLVVIFLGILCVAWMTNQGSQGSTLTYFFVVFVVIKLILPPPLDKWLMGIAFAAILGLYGLEHRHPDWIIPYLNAEHMFLDKVMSTAICLFMLTILVHLVAKEYRSEKSRSELLYLQTLKGKEELEYALTEIKVLRGILPICGFCKRIRDENNQWRTIENYISTHSEARFTHSFCPDCGRLHYPDYQQK